MIKKIWPPAGFEHATSGFLNAMTPTLVNYSRHCNMRALMSARHGQFQEKEKTPTTELNILLSKIFLTENNEKRNKDRICRNWDK